MTPHFTSSHVTSNLGSRFTFTLAAGVLVLVALTVLVVPSMQPQPEPPRIVASLQNVRDYAPTRDLTTPNYAVDGDRLYAGEPLYWTEMPLPPEVIPSAVAVDARTNAVYLGAANELAIYRTLDGGRRWLRVPLVRDEVGGVTDIAVDSFQRILYVGTDAALLYRLRDSGSTVTVNGVLLLDEPVLEVIADTTGAGMAFARTATNFYAAEQYGLAWRRIGALPSTVTAIALADGAPVTIYAGTAQDGLFVSEDGVTWRAASGELGLDDRFAVEALAVDPIRPDVLYAALGTATSEGKSESKSGAVEHWVDVSEDRGATWLPLETKLETRTATLIPANGRPHSVYVLSDRSRTPLALGGAPVAGAVDTPPAPPQDHIGWLATVISWAAAGIAALALILALIFDLANYRARPLSTAMVDRSLRERW